MKMLQAIQTVLEVAACVAIIGGLFNERRIALWERRTFRKIKRRLNNAKNANRSRSSGRA